MKKTVSLVCAFAILLCGIFTFAGCENNTPETPNNDEQLKSVFESIESLSKTTAAGNGDNKNAIDELSAKIAELKNSLPAESSDSAKLIAALTAKIAELTKASETQTTVSQENAKLIAALQSEIAELTEKKPEYVSYAAEAYQKVIYIDKMLSDRDCYSGENMKLCQKWIHTSLLQAGYTERDIEYQDVEITKYVKLTDNLKTAYSAAKSAVTDGKKYKKSGKNYIEDEAGTYTKATVTIQNIIVTKKGNSEKQIIVGMHYDGDGSGDNGSGIALGLTTAEKLCKAATPYTIKFVFFTGEEYGMLGSSAYAASLSEAEIKNTLYMINMDSLICGDYCYLYGGVQDNKTKTVTQTEAYDNAMKIAAQLGLEFKSNPWTWDNLSPDDQKKGVPSYASPSTGNWSDHAPFQKIGIPYLYFEATNWDIPDYTGYGETYLIGMLMNTKNDYLEYIEQYFPGRPMHHLDMFSKLLNQLLVTEYI